MDEKVARVLDIAKRLQVLIEEMRDDDMKEFVGEHSQWAGNHLHEVQQQLVENLIVYWGKQGWSKIDMEYVRGVGLVKK